MILMEADWFKFEHLEHDDTNFGVTRTARGNPTQVSHWVNNSTSLTTQLSYDMTGQVTRLLTLRVMRLHTVIWTAFMMTTAPIRQTNMPYRKRQMLIPRKLRRRSVAFTAGYYYGSGSRALSADLNGATTYFHFQDALDRPTQTNYPIGWAMGSYTSSTNTTLMSHRRSISFHRLYQLPTQSGSVRSLGRTISEKLVNSPLGAVSVDTTYDAAGRAESKAIRTLIQPIPRTF